MPRWVHLGSGALLSLAQAIPWQGKGDQAALGGTGPLLGLRMSYLVAIGAGTAVELHRVLAACPVVLAWAGEAGVALGHNVDVHWPCIAKPLSVGGRSPKGLSPSLPRSSAPSSDSCQPLPISLRSGRLALSSQYMQSSQSPLYSATVRGGICGGTATEAFCSQINYCN